MAEEYKQENRFLAGLKNLVIFLLLAGIVLASFWVSYQLGRRILLPVKKFPEKEIEALIPEPPASIKALQEAMSSEVKTQVLKEEIKVPLPPPRKATMVAKPTIPRKSSKVSPAKPRSGVHYYKVQVALDPDKEKAQSLAEQLKKSGFDIYLKKEARGWRVQAGAFRSQAEAEALRRKVLEKGFQSQTIYE
jgi:cell division septation protein DedD